MSTNRRLGRLAGVLVAVAVLLLGSCAVVPDTGSFQSTPRLDQPAEPSGTGPSSAHDDEPTQAPLTEPTSNAPEKAEEITGETGQVVGANFVGTTARSVAAPSMWWTWTAPTTGTFRFSTFGSEMDTVLTVHSGDPGDLQDIATNDDDGDVTSSAVEVTADEGEQLFIEVAAKDDGAGLVALGWQPAPDTDTSGPAVRSTEELSMTTLAANSFAAIPVSTNTGEKPQSKTWQHGGTWWAVMSSTAVQPAGAWLWRLGPDGLWSNVLQLSSSTDVRADTKRQGDLTHVFLHGPTSALVSLVYRPSDGSYAVWSGRTQPTAVSLPGSETATIDIDSTGRMWLAADTSSSIQVRWSDAPYSSFSSPITLASNIPADDIAVVTALPTGRIGVLWSNQSTKRFGFRTHVDGAPPTTWTADEVPAGQSALNVGKGMADDHLNVAVASDGTLYAAVKTSYDQTDQTVIGLLVRRPNGTWDPLLEVDRKGTRPIVLLNEAAGVVHVLYTETERLDDILVKSTPIGLIDLSSPAEHALDGTYNNVTSTKENWTVGAVALASSATQASHVVVTLPPPPGTPTAGSATISTVEGQLVQGVLPVTSSSGGPLLFQVQDQPTSGTVSLTDPATGSFTYIPATGYVGTDTFTYRIQDGDLWSDPGTITITVTSVTGLVGAWDLDEGQGSTAADSSGFGNDGAIRGTPDWVQGVTGTALDLDGTTDYIQVPDSDTVDLSDALTISAWIRPERAATQYVVKKAAQNATNGYELGLSSGGTAFVRFNQRTSADTYRVNSTSTYPTDGQTWMHLAATYDGTTIRLYVNGVQEGSKAGPSTVATNTLDLALGSETGGVRPFNGTLDAIQLNTQALTPEQVADLATRETPTPVAPVAADAALNTVEGQLVQGVLPVTSSSGGPLLFQVQDQPTSGTVSLTDPATGSFTYIPATGYVGTDTFTYRIQDGDLWSDPGTITITVIAGPTPQSTLVGDWRMDEASGTTVNDVSEAANTGTVVGSATWVAGFTGGALRLDGSTGLVRVSDSSTLDLTEELTIAAWVQPERFATQYVVKKATQGGVDGYELGLSSSGIPFFRLNQASSGDTYRVNATSPHPIDGRWVHLAATFDGSVMRIFVDGAEQASRPAATTIVANTLDLALGAEPGGFRPLRGSLDAVQVHGRALDPGEIAVLANP